MDDDVNIDNIHLLAVFLYGCIFLYIVGFFMMSLDMLHLFPECGNIIQHAYRDGRLEEIVLRHLGAEDGNAVIARDIRFV